MFPERSNIAITPCSLAQPFKREQKGKVSQGLQCVPVGGEKLEGTLREALRYAEYKAKLFQFS
jgi:hypothetical protein